MNKNNKVNGRIIPHSYRFNMVVYTIKNILSVLFPLITFPYVSRILGVNNLGRFNFSTTIVSYFSLVASFGINTFAVREGVKLKDKREDFEKFAGEVFGINVLSTILAYLLLIFYLILSSKADAYATIIMIYSCSILLTSLGREWIFVIYEEYTYITIRYIMIHVLSILLLFIFVRQENDLIPYTIICVLSSSGANLFNLIKSRKFARLRVILNKNAIKYCRPMLYFFAATIATTIYVNSDVTILGYLCDDYTVGLYSVSVKIYNIIKTVLISLITVTIPRMASMVGSSETEKNNLIKLCRDIMNILLTILLPVLIGIIVTAKDLILIVSGENYVEATRSLQLLSLALVFCVIGYFWGDGILVAYRKEKVLLIGVTVSAVVNLCLNFILIPLLGIDAAAMTTVIAEFISAMIFIFFGRKCVSGFISIKTIVKSLIGCIAIVVIGFFTNYFISSYIIRLSVTIIMSFVFYFLIEYLLRNEVIISICSNIINKIRRK